MNDEIKVGSSVTLISGGPEMTVGTVNVNETVVCYWFVGAENKQQVFPLAVLKLYKKGNIISAL